MNADVHLTLESLAGAVASKAVGLFETSMRNQVQQVMSCFAHLKPEVKYEPLTDSISVGISPSADRTAAHTTAEALDAVNKLAKDQGKIIGVIIDEFQAFSQREGIAAERQLRTAIQLHNNLAYVFSGSNTRLMYAMISKHKRPFYQAGKAISIGPVPTDDMSAFLIKGFEQIQGTLTPAAALRIQELSEYVPYNIQKLAAHIFYAL